MIKKLLAISLCLALLLGSAALAEQPVLEDPVLVTVNGQEIKKSQVDALMPQLLQQQYIGDASEYAKVLDVMVRREIMHKKVKEMGFDQFSQQEEDAFAAEAQKQWDAILAYFSDYHQSEDSEEAKAAARVQAEQELTAAGISYQSLLADVRSNAGLDRMTEHLLAGYHPSEEEIQKVFQEVGALYQQRYENDVPQYEYMTRYANQPSWYTPAGYRGIVHILLTPGEELLNKYKTLSATFEEQHNKGEVPLTDNGTDQPAQTEEKPAEPVTQQMVDEACQAILDAKAEEIKMITERLGRGESFLDLIKEYGEDPGMTVEANLKEGYPVNANSILYDPVFTAAAFSEKMQKPGDTSDPVVGMYGIHILHYLKDLPSGLVLTDAIRQEIEDYLLGMKQNEALNAAFQSWLPQEQVSYHQEAIDKATQEAAAHLQSPEEDPLEAVPSQEESQPNP